MTDPTHISKPTRSARWLDGALVLSAAALMCLALVQVASTSAFQISARASDSRAGLLATIGEYTLLSVDIGNDDAVLLLDGRAEEVVAYRADNQQVLQVVQRLNLPRTFTEARARTGARPTSDNQDSGPPARDNRTNPPR